MKPEIKKVLAYVFVYIGLTILFTSLMIGTYLLPDTNIRGHIEESIALLKNEGIGYAPLFQNASATLDTFTDALILNTALNKGGQDSTVANAMENSYYDQEGEEMTASLQTAVYNDVVNNKEYSRYWHGVQVLIRPLLLFFNYSEIRYILMVTIFILLGIVYSMLGKQLGTRYAIAFSITISLMFIVLIPMSIQYSSIFLVTLVSMIAVLLLYKKKKEKFVPMLFFVIGAFATFFDLLTYPLVTLGLPIVLAVILEHEKGMSLVKQILFIIKLGVLWAIGYGLLFFTKWVIASIVLHKDAITLALETILFRVNGDDDHPVNRLNVISNNFNYFFIPVARHILTVIFTIWMVSFILFRKNIKDCKIVIPLLCIAVVPYAWYFLFSGHSSIHCWFTNKIQAMSLFAILCAMGQTIDKNKIGKLVKNVRKKGV